MRAFTIRPPVAASAIVLVLALAALAGPAAAWDWEAIWSQGGYEFENGTHVSMDDAGNVYVAGWASIWDRGDDDIVVIKYSSSGVKQWDYMYDAGLHSSLGYDHPVGVGTDAAGNVYVAGKARFERSGLQDYDLVTIKLNDAGVEQWRRYYDWTGGSSDHGDDVAVDMAVDADGNVWVLGSSDGAYVTVKYDAAGTRQWATRYEGGHAGANSDARALAIDRQGNVVVTGASQGAVYHGYDYVTIKYNGAGVQQWVARYDNDDQQTSFDPADVAVDAAGNVAVTGSFDAGDGDFDIATVYYTSDGTEVWDDTWSGSGFAGVFSDHGTGVAFDSQGNLMAVGWTTQNVTAADYLTIKYSSAGVRLWTRTYNEVPGAVGSGESLDWAYDVGVDGAGRVTVIGKLDVDYQGIATQETYGVVTYSPEGTILDVRHWDAEPGFPLLDEALEVAVTPAGDIAVTGLAGGSATFDDIGTVAVYGDGLIFEDGFESGDTSRWSSAVGE